MAKPDNHRRGGGLARDHFWHPSCPRALPQALLLGLLAGCSSYNVQEPPAPKAETMPYQQTESMVIIGVDPYVQPDKAKAIFGEDMRAAGVIPLHIVARNLGEQTVRIEVKNFKLSLPGEEVVAPRPGAEVAALFNPQGGAWDQAGTGIGVLGQFGGPIGGLLAGIVGRVVSGTVHGSRQNVSAARQQDYARKEFKDVALGKNEWTRGFLFFSLPAGTASFDEASLILDLHETATANTRIKVALKGLGYQAKPAKK